MRQSLRNARKSNRKRLARKGRAPIYHERVADRQMARARRLNLLPEGKRSKMVAGEFEMGSSIGGKSRCSQRRINHRMRLIPGSPGMAGGPSYHCINPGCQANC